jgi:hypothetical protein
MFFERIFRPEVWFYLSGLFVAIVAVHCVARHRLGVTDASHGGKALAFLFWALFALSQAYYRY